MWRAERTAITNPLKWERAWRIQRTGSRQLKHHELKGNVLRWGQRVSKWHIPSKDSGSHFKICSTFEVSTEPACRTKASIVSHTNIIGTRNLLFRVSKLSLKYSSHESLNPEWHTWPLESPLVHILTLPGPCLSPDTCSDPNYWYRTGAYLIPVYVTSNITLVLHLPPPNSC